MLQELHNISGLRLSVHDTDFHEIEAYPKGLCSLCAMVQQNEQALQICHQTDYAAFERAKKTQQFSIYQCRFGLYEAVAPIFSFGTLIGYLMMGQTLCSPENNRMWMSRPRNTGSRCSAACRSIRSLQSFVTRD